MKIVLIIIGGLLGLVLLGCLFPTALAVLIAYFIFDGNLFAQVVTVIIGIIVNIIFIAGVVLDSDSGGSGSYDGGSGLNPWGLAGFLMTSGLLGRKDDD